MRQNLPQEMGEYVSPLAKSKLFPGLHGIKAWVQLWGVSSQGVGPHVPIYLETAKKEAQSNRSPAAD